MSIVLNQYLEIRTDEDGTKKPFGKCGFQTQSPKTDKYVLANLAAVERAMDAGMLTDLDGNVCKDGAYITLICRVNKTKSASEIDQVTSLRNADGSAIAVPAPAAASAEPDPF